MALGGVVIWALTRFVGNVHNAQVSQSVIVRKAETACVLDNVLCHAGADHFSSEESAQAYLISPEHLAALKAQQAEEDQAKKR